MIAEVDPRLKEPARPLPQYPVRLDERDCVGCGEPVAPGSLYVPGRAGPKHLGCPERPPRDRA